MSKRNNCKTQSKTIRQFFGSFKTLSFLYFILWHFWSFSGMKNNAMYLWIILSCAEGGGSRLEFQGCGEVTLVKVYSSVVLQAQERDISRRNILNTFGEDTSQDQQGWATSHISRSSSPTV